jgi:hypothetical protein
MRRPVAIVHASASRRIDAMMILPFIGFGAATAYALAGRRSAALFVWAASLAMMLVLFRLHASDELALRF